MYVRKVRESAGKFVKHNNHGNKRGSGYYCQVIKDEHGFPVKTIWHVCRGETYKVRRNRKRLRASMSNQPG